MSDTPKTVFVTRYALSGGIIEREVDQRYDGDKADNITVKWPGGLNGVASFWGKDWHTTREAAVARANAMRDAKLKSLDKQAEKLRKLAF